MRKEEREILKGLLSAIEQYQAVYEDRSEQAMEIATSFGSLKDDLRCLIEYDEKHKEEKK